MKIAIIGQQDFGKAVLDAFLARGDEVAGVFCAPEKEGAKADLLKVAAQEKGVEVYQFPSLRNKDAHDALRALNADIGIMAYVLQFAPQEFVKIPKKGTIQYHPSLLPKYRGPSSINWPIIRGDAKTGLSIFRPNDGLDEGPVILQKETPLGPDDTLGSVYFDRLFPMGVAALLEAADLVMAGKHRETVQDEARASYEGWCRTAEAKINWAIRRGKGKDRRDFRNQPRELLRDRSGRTNRGPQGKARRRQESIRGRTRGAERPHSGHPARELTRGARAAGRWATVRRVFLLRVSSLNTRTLSHGSWAQPGQPDSPRLKI